MPSDDRTDRVERALEALKGPRERFLSAVVGAVDEVRAFVAAHQPSPNGNAADAAAVALGGFADGRIDPARFATLFNRGGGLDAHSLARVENALSELNRVAASGDYLFRVELGAGADLRLAVAHALAFAGRAFGAAQAVELIRSGRYDPHRHKDLLDPFPFRRWNRAERQIAPPLLIELDGADLQAGALAEFLDGSVKVVLLVRAPTSPAALARLVSPGVMVMQTADPADVRRAALFDGPAVVALVPEGAALFVHDPAAGDTPAARLTVSHLPTGEGLKPLGAKSVFQQTEELAMLRALAAAGAPAAARASAEADAPAPAASTSAVDAQTSAGAAQAPPSDADVLAAWLLRQAGLEG